MATTTTTTTTAPEIAAGLLRPPELPPKYSNTDDEFELLLVERGGAILELVTGARRKYENKHMALAREVHTQTSLRLPPIVPALQNSQVRDRVLTATADVAAEVAVFHVLLQRADTHRMRDRLITPHALLAIDVLSDTSASALEVECLTARVGAPVRLVWCPLWLLKRLALPPMSPVAGTGRRRRALGPLLQWYMRHHIAYELLSVPGALLSRPYTVDDAGSVLRQHHLSPASSPTTNAVAYELAGERKYSTDWAVVAASAATLAAARRVNAQSAVSPKPAVAAPLALAICCSDMVDDDNDDDDRHYRQRLSSPSSWNMLLRQVPGKRGTLMLDLVCTRTPVCNAASERAIKGAVVRTMRECFGLICKAEVHPIPTQQQQQQEDVDKETCWKLMCMRVGHSSAVSLLGKPAALQAPSYDALAGWQWWSLQRIQHLHIMRTKATTTTTTTAGHPRMFLGRPIESYYFGPALTEFMRCDGWYACCPSSANNVALAALWRPPAQPAAIAAADATTTTAPRARGPLEDGEEEEDEEEVDVICTPPVPKLPPLLPLHRPLAVPAPTAAAAAVVAATTAVSAKHPPIGSQRAPRQKNAAENNLSVWAQLVAMTGRFDPAHLQWNRQAVVVVCAAAAADARAAAQDNNKDTARSPSRGPPSPERYPRYRHPHYFRHRAEDEEDTM